MKDGVFSEWKGQRPLKLLPTFLRATDCETTSIISVRFLISSMTLSGIEYFNVSVINQAFFKLEKDAELKIKQSELDEIVKETEKEESDLLKKSSNYESKIDESLLISYKKIRASVRNGLAVVAVERGASAGSFFTIPPQVQLDIASRKNSLLMNTVEEFWLTKNWLKKKMKK